MLLGMGLVGFRLWGITWPAPGHHRRLTCQGLTWQRLAFPGHTCRGLSHTTLPASSTRPNHRTEPSTLRCVSEPSCRGVPMFVSPIVSPTSLSRLPHLPCLLFIAPNLRPCAVCRNLPVGACQSLSLPRLSYVSPTSLPRLSHVSPEDSPTRRRRHQVPNLRLARCGGAFLPGATDVRRGLPTACSPLRRPLWRSASVSPILLLTSTHALACPPIWSLHPSPDMS